VGRDPPPLRGARVKQDAAAGSPGLVDRAGRIDSFSYTLVSLFRYRELLKNLVFKDLKLKYRGSVLGFLWSLFNPLLMIGVYTFAFKYIIGNRIPDFVFYVMLGILAWTFFVNSLMMSTGAIVDNSGLLKSVFFPRAILPIASVLFNFAQYLLTVLVFLPVMMALYDRPLAAPMLAYPVFLVLQLLFTVGLALLVATWTAFFRDVKHFLEIFLAVLFWLTPIVYLSALPRPEFQPWLMLAPMTPFITAYHDIFFYGRWPSGSVWMLATVYACAAFAFGLALILKREDQFSEAL
jgi:lipopolysaccharide transport system permease protein